MSRESYIATKERISELRAKQLGHSYAEREAASEIEWLIKEQARLEDEILCLEIHLDMIRKELPELSLKNSDKAWSILTGIRSWF